MATCDPTLSETLKSTSDGTSPGVVGHACERIRPHLEVRGKFLFADEQKLWIRGICYELPTAIDSDAEVPDRDLVACDFAEFAAAGVNAISLSEVPPVWLLDLAWTHDIRVMVGLSWARHAAFLDDASVRTQIIQEAREGVQGCAGHPAVLCYTLGHEIPASLVRWHGRRAVEKILQDLSAVARHEDPGVPITYTNSSSTEYLSLPFIDLFCFGVRLETREGFVDYLARLQNLAGEKPLILSDVATTDAAAAQPKNDEDSRWRIRAAFAGGCAGTFARVSNAAETSSQAQRFDLAAVRSAYAEVPFPAGARWPKVTVVVCSFNGEPTIRDTLNGLAALEYPDYEVIVVNDGSTDATAEIAAAYPFRLISTENRGLSNARNTGWQEAAGEIIAYIDDDAYPDPHWLHFLAHVFETTEYVGVGGPNIAPPGDGPIADCVANAPGGPVHVLISDTEAEHIPGCNMAFRRSSLAAIDGFDARYRAAGDDVDLCWRLQDRGWHIGFHPSAVVWHHRRNSVKMYWKQQQGYGKAEALLEEKWPEKYNSMGHYSWSGRLYGKGLTRHLNLGRTRIYEPRSAVALPATAVEPPPSYLLLLPLMPEWFLLIAGLAILALLGFSWPPLLWLFPVLAIAIALPIAQAVISASAAIFPTPRPLARERSRLRVVTAGLHILQPVARLKGRLAHGLTPWRSRLGTQPVWRLQEEHALSGVNRSPRDRVLEDIVTAMRARRANVQRGDPDGNWDLEVTAGLFGRARLTLVELPGPKPGKQLYCRSRVSIPAGVAVLAAALGAAAVAALLQGAAFAGIVLGVAAVGPAWLSFRQSGATLAAIGAAVREVSGEPTHQREPAAVRRLE